MPGCETCRYFSRAYYAKGVPWCQYGTRYSGARPMTTGLIYSNDENCPAWRPTWGRRP